LYDFDPSIGRSVEQLRSMNENVEDLCLTFSVNYVSFGEVHTADLKENGRNIPVTNKNTVEYIDLLTEYYLVNSIKNQYEPFVKGLRMVLKGKAFELFNHDELEKLICGNPTLDFDALEVATTYDNGYHSDHLAIRNFWEIVKSFDHEQKKKFLFFVTGSDRAPLRGLGKLGLKIIRNGSDPYDGQQLPTSHTCFNMLMLPAYKTKDEMTTKLLTAIQYAEGFGLQ